MTEGPAVQTDGVRIRMTRPPSSVVLKKLVLIENVANSNGLRAVHIS